jgi:hypothetical protein
VCGAPCSQGRGSFHTPAATRRNCSEQAARSLQAERGRALEDRQGDPPVHRLARQSFGDWLDSRPEDDEPLSTQEQAALADSDADIAAGRILSYAEVKQALDAG